MVLLQWVVVVLLGLGAAALVWKRREVAHWEGLVFGGRIPVGCAWIQALSLIAVAVAWLLLVD